jgi:hypothetical protein
MELPIPILRTAASVEQEEEVMVEVGCSSEEQLYY